MYEAVYRLGSRELHSCLAMAEGLTPQRASHILQALETGLQKLDGSGFSTRLEHTGSGLMRLMIWVHRWSGSPLGAGQILTGWIQGAAYETPWNYPASAPEFDALASNVPPCHLAVDPAGYQLPGDAGAALAPRFILVESLAPLLRVFTALDWPLSYQLNAAPWLPDRETEREARKYAVRLESRPGLPSALRDLQLSLAGHIQQRGFLIQELLAVPEEAMREAAGEILEDDFAQSMGKLGFEACPLEREDQTDWLTSGMHPSFLEDPAGAGTALIVKAAQWLEPGLLKPSWQALSALMPQPRTSRAAFGHMPEAFISYASRDFDFASRICGALESQGCSCWIAPRNIPPGDSYTDAIMRGIECARVLVILLSEHSYDSKHVTREVECALNRNKTLLPILVDESNPRGSLEYLVSTCQRLEAGRMHFDDLIRELSDRIHPQP